MPTFLTDLVDAMRLLPTASLRVLRKHMEKKKKAILYIRNSLARADSN